VVRNPALRMRVNLSRELFNTRQFAVDRVLFERVARLNSGLTHSFPLHT
jgi:hypothetical protein